MNNTFRYIFFALVFVLAGLFLVSIPRLAIPLSISFVIYLICNPLVPTIVKLGFSRVMAIFFIMLTILFALIYPLVSIVPIVTKETQNFKYYIPKVESYINNEYEKAKIKVYNKTGYQIDDKYIKQATQYVKTGTTNVILKLPQLAAAVIEWFFLVPLFVFFFLKDGRTFKNLLLRLAPNPIFERFYFITHHFNRQLGDYIFAKFVEALIVGITVTAGLLILDIRFSVLLGLVAGVTNVIPYLGPVLGLVPALVVGLAEYGVGSSLGGMIIVYSIANVIDLAFVFPILVSKIVDLHPLIVVISVILGSQYLGIIGMVISIPLAAALKLIFTEVKEEIYQSAFR